MADVSSEFANISFRDIGTAAQNLARVGERVPAAVHATLVQLLAESPDPDSALNLFERLTAVAGSEVTRIFERHQFLLHYVVAVFAYSKYLGETLIQNPDLIQGLLREKSLDLTHSRDEFAGAFARFRSRSLETDVSLLLARFKRREYVRIMLRDVLRIATLAEATSEISALSDVLIEEALRDTDQQLRNRYGPPQHLDEQGRLVDSPFAVFSLGKLGGNELNYSSDIDLLFLYGDGAEPAGAPISNREYFVRLAQQLTEALSRITKEGAPFRIDLRLRPQGGEGEPAVGLAHALDYYANRAADWELQALIKLRHSAGDQALAREFIRRVQPFVYTEKLNFAAIETALETREKIGQRRRHAMVAHKASGIDVKLDRGGIRDIEFLVQCLQRVYGGSEPWLRSGGTLFSLQKLHDKGHISGKDFHELTIAYQFLRTIEHRLQLRHGQQTHRLPPSEQELHVLARMVLGPDASPDDVIKQVRKRMAAIAEIYSRIIHQQQIQQHRDPDLRAHSAITGREDANRQLLDRLAVDAPQIHALVQQSDLVQHARRNLYRFLAAAATSADRYATVVRSPDAVARAVQLFAVSDYLTDILVRHPDEITTLRNSGAVSTAGEFAVAADATYEQKLCILRREYRRRVFASGARDVNSARNIYDSLAETSAAADAAISEALKIAGGPAGFSILALGRLGTGEHDLISDADLLFVRDEGVDSVEALRTAERVVEILSAYTRDGTVFPVDARLRPHGGEGELVVAPTTLAAYFEREAQPWEALTYTKLRYVTGERRLADQAIRAVHESASRFARDPHLAASLREMRSKLEKTDTEAGNLKTGPGGLYDIDFIVGAMLVRHGIADCQGNLRQRLRVLHERCLLDQADWKRLDRHSELLRTVEHVIRLAVGKSRKTLPVAGPVRAACEELCGRILKRDFPEGLEMTLRFTLVGVREVYKRIMGALAQAAPEHRGGYGE